MFNRHRHNGFKALRAKSKIFMVLGLITLISLIALETTNLLAAHAGPPAGRQLVNTFGDKDDLPFAPPGAITCSRSQNGHGAIQGTITDTKTGKPVASA